MSDHRMLQIECAAGSDRDKTVSQKGYFRVGVFYLNCVQNRQSQDCIAKRTWTNN